MPKKILLLAANPKNTSRLRLDQEARDIAEGLKLSQQRDEFVLTQRHAVRPRDIQRAMLDEKPQIVHFSGHGAGEEGLAFENETGQAKLVSGAALAGLFRLFADQLECVVLNGCYSKAQADAIAQHIPYVIGMEQAIGDQAAIEFAVGFYDALGAGESIEFAYQLGCSAVQMAGIEEQLTPVLIKKPAAPSAEPAVLPPPSSPAPAPAASATLAALTNQAIKVFVSYSHKDEALREELDAHLSNLRRQGKIAAWNDRAIEAGTVWNDEIRSQLESSRIILLLISPQFMASEYCYDKEMMRAIERHNAGEARVIPIFLRPTDWENTPFSKLQGLPRDGKPVTQWADRDEAFLNVVQGIRRAVETLQAQGK